MENNLNSLLFALLNSAIHSKALSEDEKALFSPEQLGQLYFLSKRHDLSHLISEALHINGLMDENNKYCKKFQNDQFSAVYRCEQMTFALSTVTTALEKAKIPFIPLKGSILRNYYPKLWMRTSCDIDILIEKKNLPEASDYLTRNLGFSKIMKTSHDASFKTSNDVTLELHFDLIEDGRAKDCRLILSRFFEASRPCSGFAYKRESTPEMFYFYHIAHMAKHLEGGGCGIRPFLDLWILNREKAYNKEALYDLLKQGGLLKFASVCDELSQAWFSGKEYTEASLKTQEFILSGGAYGNALNRVKVTQAKQGGKLSLIISRIFPPYIKLKAMYPVLEKYPLLTPFCHIARWCRIILKGHIKRGAKEFVINKNLSKEQYSQMQQFMDEIGLS